MLFQASPWGLTAGIRFRPCSANVKRMRPSKVIAIGGAILGAIGVIALVVRKPSQPIRRVALIGDSYAVGLGPELVKLLTEFQYEGHVGTNTWQWAHRTGCGRCGDWLASFKPEVVLVSLGVNDGGEPKLSNYQAIVQNLHGLGARVVWIEPPAAVNTPSRALIASLGISTVPATRVPLGADNLHPLGGEYSTWAKEIAEALGT